MDKYKIQNQWVIKQSERAVAKLLALPTLGHEPFPVMSSKLSARSDTMSSRRSDRRVMLLTAYEFGNSRAAGGVIIVPASVAVRFPAIFARLVAASDGGVKRKLYADRFWASTRSSESAFVGAYGGAAAAPSTAPTYAGTLPPPPPPLSRLLQQQQQPRSLIQSMEIESGFEAADLVGESDEEIEQDFLFLFDAAPSNDDSEANEGHLKAIANDAKKAKKDTALRANLARLPHDTIVQVVEYLAPKDLARLVLTSTTPPAATVMPELWKNHLMAMLPTPSDRQYHSVDYEEDVTTKVQAESILSIIEMQKHGDRRDGAWAPPAQFADFALLDSMRCTNCVAPLLGAEEAHVCPLIHDSPSNEGLAHVLCGKCVCSCACFTCGEHENDEERRYHGQCDRCGQAVCEMCRDEFRNVLSFCETGDCPSLCEDCDTKRQFCGNDYCYENSCGEPECLKKTLRTCTEKYCMRSTCISCIINSSAGETWSRQPCDGCGHDRCRHHVICWDVGVFDCGVCERSVCFKCDPALVKHCDDCSLPICSKCLVDDGVLTDRQWCHRCYAGTADTPPTLKLRCQWRTSGGGEVAGGTGNQGATARGGGTAARASRRLARTAHRAARRASSTRMQASASMHLSFCPRTCASSPIAL